MNPTVLGGAAALLLLALWWSGRRRPATLLRSTDASAIAALNRAQIAAVHRSVSGDDGQQQPVDAEAQALPHPLPAEPPAPCLAQHLLLRRLSLAFCQDPATRLDALRQARAWGHRATVPLLLRGLRDSDPAVVREAALAMERFRGRSVAAGSVQLSPAPLPRNVARTR